MMSDYDKNKFHRRTKYYPSQREGSYGIRPYKSTGYVKYDRDYKDTDRSESKEKVIAQPTILLKAREPNSERSISPKRQSKENEVPATANATSHESQTFPSLMTECVKLIEDNNINIESVHDSLLDSPDFLVVGILGPQGVGKSTVMNLIAQNKLTQQIKSDIFNYIGESCETTEPIKILTDNVSNLKVEDAKLDCTKETISSNVIFKPQSLEQIEVGSYGTSGVDLFVTSNRVFLLDCQPITSAAALDETVQNDVKRNVTEFLPIENTAEIQSLQMATFILSVCHVVILLQDWFFDSNFVRFLQTAEMLKPSIPTVEEDFMEYFPHVMILHNRATMEDFTPNKFKSMQQIYRSVFGKSKLRFESSMGLATGKIMHSLSPETCGEPLNLFLLPEYEQDKDTKYYGHPPFDELVRELRAQIHGVTRIPLLSAQLTEKNWLQFSSKVWETIKKSSFFVEYSKLMP